MLLECDIEVSYETLRRWEVKFGPTIAGGLRCRVYRPGDIRYPDEVRVTVRGERFWLWRAVDQNGLVLDETGGSGNLNSRDKWIFRTTAA